MPSAEHVQRQVAITVVIAVIEPPLLLPMNRIIGGIKIEDDLTWCPFVSFQRKIDEKTSNRHRIVTDLVVARRLQLAQLQTIERRLAGYWPTIRAPAVSLPASTAMIGSCRRSSWSLTSSYPSAMPNTRCPISVATWCSTSSGHRSS